MAPMADQEGPDAPERTGGMIALVPRAADARKLVVDGGDPVEELHLTLAYLGDDVTDWPGEQTAELLGDVRAIVSTLPPMQARVMAHALFNPDGHADRDPCAVHLVGDSPELAPLQQEMADLAPVPQHDPVIFHITAGYGLDVGALNYTGPVTFDRVRVALGGQITDFELTGDDVEDEPLDDADDAPLGETKADPAAAEQQQSGKKKRKVASKAGEQRYGLPIGTELGQARGTEGARRAQADPRAKERYDAFMALGDMESMRARALEQSDDDLKSLTEIMYSFKTSNPRVVAARNALAAELRRRGFDERDHGSLVGGKRAARPSKGRTSSSNGSRSSSSGRGSMSSTEDRAWRARAARSGGHIRTDELTEDALKKLKAAGWKGNPDDRMEALYPPEKSVAGYLGEHYERKARADEQLDDDLEVKRTTSKPWETGKLKKAGHTVSKAKGEDGDAYPIKTIGDLAAAVKRAKKIKDPERAAKVWKHLRAEAKRLKAPNMIPAGAGSEEKDARAVRAIDYLLTDDDRRVIVELERKYASPDPRARRLRTYWARGAGRAKWNTFRELRNHLRKYVPAHMLNGLTANIYKQAKGTWPGRKRGDKGLEDHLDLEQKVMISADLVEEMNAGVDVEDALDEFEKMAPAVSSIEEYERALVEEMDWEVDSFGELTLQESDDDAALAVEQVDLLDDEPLPSSRRDLFSARY